MSENLSALSTSELLIRYNHAAGKLQLTPVKRFADHKTAVRRTTEILAKLGGTETGQLSQESKPSLPDPPPPLKLEARKRRPNFNFPCKISTRPPRSGTLRGLVFDALEDGATPEKLGTIISQFDAARGVETNPDTLGDRVYGAIRLLHFYCGYGLRQDQAGKIWLVREPEAA